MKFDLIIKDATAEQVSSVVSLLEAAELGESKLVQYESTLKKANQIEVQSGVGQPLGPIDAFIPPAPAVPEYQQPVPSVGINPDNMVDKSGLPWDARIHSGNKSLTAKNLWQRRRGVDDGLVAQVEAELRGVTPAPQQPQYAPAPVFTQAPDAYSNGNVQAAIPAAPVAPAAINYAPAPIAPEHAPQPAPVQQAPLPPTPTQGTDFNALMQKISQLFSTQQIGPDYIVSLTQRISQAFNSTVNAITDIANNQAMVDYAFQCIQVDGK